MKDKHPSTYLLSWEKNWRKNNFTRVCVGTRESEREREKERERERERESKGVCVSNEREKQSKCEERESDICVRVR